MLRKTLLLVSLLAVAGCPSGAWGRSLVDIDLIDRDTGQWLAETRHRGDLWVAGTPGHRYAVRLTNTTSERVLVVLSVDGVNAVTGETASPSQTGYVLGPWQTTEIAGWRKSMDDVAQFVYTTAGTVALRAGAIQRLFRDMHAGTQHVTSAPPVVRQAGRELAGLAPGKKWLFLDLVDDAGVV